MGLRVSKIRSLSQPYYLLDWILGLHLNLPILRIDGCIDSCNAKKLQRKRTSQYGYRRAKCEEPLITNNWFTSVEYNIQKVGILTEEISNMDESRFEVSNTSTTRVNCGSETYGSRA